MRTTLRQSLRRHGIRTATDFMSTYDAAQKEKRIEPYASLLAGSVPHAATDVSLLQVLRDALADDEWITQLRHWRGQVKVEEDTVEVNVEKEVEISLDSYA